MNGCGIIKDGNQVILSGQVGTKRFKIDLDGIEVLSKRVIKVTPVDENHDPFDHKKDETCRYRSKGRELIPINPLVIIKKICSFFRILFKYGSIF